MIGAPAPIRWVAGHVVYGSEGFSDPWTLFSVPMHSYDGRTTRNKLELVGHLRDFAFHLGHDFQLLRVATYFDRADYIRSRRGRSPHGELRDAYLREGASELYGQIAGEPRLFLAVSHRQPGKSRRETAADPLTMIKESRGKGSRVKDVALTREQRDNDQREAARIHGHIAPYLEGVRPATGEEIQWLVRRSWARGLSEPVVDPADEMVAPVVLDRSGREVLEPQEADVLRWMGGLEVGVRDLKAHGEEESGRQASLVVSRLPMTSEAPSDMLELALRPTSRLDFPVDLSISCEWIANRRALEDAEKAITDADEDAISEHDSDRGATDEAAERPDLARDQRQYLRRARAPMLRSTIVAHVAGVTREQLEERVARTRQVFEDNDCLIQRPPMQQLQAFFDGLPGQRTNLRGYKRLMTCEQLGSQVWTATHSVGSRSGWLLGTTLTASAVPVRFDPRDGSGGNRAAAIVLLGDLGAGKTAMAQKTMYEAALDGARIIDRDPKGDHTWHHLLPEDSVETITLDPSPELRGLLDPWINAPAELRTASAQTFLQSLFPRGAAANWETALVRAIHTVAERAKRPTNVEVLRALSADQNPIAQEVFEHLSNHATAGLPQLGFADPDRSARTLGQKQVTYVLTARLPLAPADRKRDEYTPSEVQGEQLAMLLSLLSMRLMVEYRAELKIQNSDESWRDLKTHYGRDEFDAQQRMGRSELSVPIIATQTPRSIGDDDNAIANLFGARFVFRMNDEDDARRALQLCKLDPNDDHMVKRLTELESGQALFCDHRSRAEFVDIHIPPTFLGHISTTPEVGRDFALA